VAAAAATGVQVGAAIVASRYVMDRIDPASLAMVRYAIGFLCLLPPLLLTARTRFARRDIWPIAVLGMARFGGTVGLLNIGLQTVPSARAALIFALFPLLTMLIGAALGRERVTRPKTIGVLLTVAGVGFVIGEKAFGGGTDWTGELFVFASAFVGAACSVFYRPYLHKYPTLPVGALAMAASVAFLAVFAAGEGFFSVWPRLPLDAWMVILFIGISSGIGYFLWLWALGRTSATRVTVFLALSPLTAAALGALLLQEAITSIMLIGFALVAAGLWVALRQRAVAPVT
ncbi:MAG: DMT family transporter, partial [Alphaproteobacteria bacterium]